MEDRLIDDIDNVLTAIIDLQKRIKLCERIYCRLLQFDLRLETLEFNNALPVKPSATERLMDMQHRLERLESYLLNGEKQ